MGRSGRRLNTERVEHGITIAMTHRFEHIPIYVEGYVGGLRADLFLLQCLSVHCEDGSNTSSISSHLIERVADLKSAAGRLEGADRLHGEESGFPGMGKRQGGFGTAHGFSVDVASAKANQKFTQAFIRFQAPRA